MMVRTNTIVKEIRRMVCATMFFNQERLWLVASIAIARIEANAYRIHSLQAVQDAVLRSHAVLGEPTVSNLLPGVWQVRIPGD